MLVADAHRMRGFRFRQFGVFAKVLTAAGLLLMAVGRAVWATVDSARRAISPAETEVRAVIATTMGAVDGNR